jgi:hypothetical protein
MSKDRRADSDFQEHLVGAPHGGVQRVRDGRKLAAGLVKQMTGGDTITGSEL